ncbi:MAG: hypothetical protein GY841_16080 [FCB group bacterium]|nr:hypothetical protein [FCB group bacterium]
MGVATVLQRAADERYAKNQRELNNWNRYQGHLSRGNTEMAKLVQPVMTPGLQRQLQGTLAAETAQFNLDSARRTAGQSASMYGQNAWRGGGSSNLDALANTFLGAWQTQMGNTQGIFNTAIQNSQDAYAAVGSGDRMTPEMQQLYDQIQGDYEQYKSDFSGLKESSLADAQRSMAERAEAYGKFKDSIQYNEGEARARAIGTVKRQQALQQDEINRRLSSYGLDPTNYQHLMQDQGMALNRVWAGNEAERLASDRYKADLTQLHGMADPSLGASIAGNIAGGENQYRQSAADVIALGTANRARNDALRAQIAQNQGQLALGYGNTMAAPYGSLASSLVGMSLSQGGMQQPMSLAQSYLQSPGGWAAAPTNTTIRRNTPEGSGYKLDDINSLKPPIGTAKAPGGLG